MANYQNSRKARLSIFKTKNLTTERGHWHGVPYDHILPVEQQEKNIIEAIRKDFWNYNKDKNIKLHQFFHHLNSSQALCFNLFFPLFHFDKKYLTYVLHRIIEVVPTNATENENRNMLFSIKDALAANQFANQLEEEFLIKNLFLNCEFEKILDKDEQTNFDFYVEQQNDHKVLFEIKYTENKFGKSVADKSHIQKYNTIYRPKLEKLLRPEFLTQDFVINNYQLVRNLSYIDEFTTVVFIFPEANNTLKETANLISEVILPEYIQQIRVIHLESLIRQILQSDYLKQVHPIYNTFKEIYID